MEGISLIIHLNPKIWWATFYNNIDFFSSSFTREFMDWVKWNSHETFQMKLHFYQNEMACFL